MTQPGILVQERVLLLAERSGTDQSARFFRKAFSLPQGCVRLVITLTTDSPHPVQLPICLFDPCGNPRLMKAGHRVTQETLTYDIGEEYACAGAIPGPLAEGEWKLVIYKRRMTDDVPVELTIAWEAGENHACHKAPPITFAADCLNKERRWYQGELHTHSDESTGRTSVAEVIDAARACGLDFLAITDHFTAAHWHTIQSVYDGQAPLLLQSMEVSGDRGHANFHGLQQWLNPLVDDNEDLTEFLGLAERPSMNQLADAAHAQGGLMCINHPLSGEMGWRYHDFDMHKADLIETWCLSEQDATLGYPAFYDMLLARGYRLTAVGSSDSHHPTRPGPWQLGQVRTFIYANELSQKGLLDGLKAGHAYISVNGCEMNLTASNGHTTAMMGDELAMEVGRPVCVTVELSRHPTGNLFLYYNGCLLESCYVDHTEPAAFSFWLPEELSAEHAYVRAEFYEVEGKLPYYGYSWRNWQSLRLMSNPIYIKKGNEA